MSIRIIVDETELPESSPSSPKTPTLRHSWEITLREPSIHVNETDDETAAGLQTPRTSMPVDHTSLYSRLAQQADQRDYFPWKNGRRHRKSKRTSIFEEEGEEEEEEEEEEKEEQRVPLSNSVVRNFAKDATQKHAEELYEEIVASGKSTWPQMEWLDQLGLPCYPYRLPKENKKVAPNAIASDTSASSSAEEPPPSNLSPSIHTSGTRGGSEGSGSSHYSASSVTQDELARNMGWTFTIPGGLVDRERKDPIKVYGKRWQYSISRRAVHNIRLSPEKKQDRGPKQEQLDVDRGLHNNIRQERMRLNDLTMVLPDEWRVEARAREPPYLRLPAKYEEWLPEQEKKSTRVRYEPDIADYIQTESIGSAITALSSDREAPPLILVRENRPEDHRDFEEMRDLADRKEYKLPKTSGSRWDARRQEIALALKKEVDKRNEKWKRWHSIHLLIYTIESYPDWKNYVLYATQREIEQDDRLRCTGNPALNEDDGDHPERSPFKKISEFLTYDGVGPLSSEGAVERIVGSLLMGVVVGKGAVDRHNVPLNFPPIMSVFGSHPSPDMYLRAISGSISKDWDPSLSPVLFAAECKQAQTHTINTRAQLATAFQASLIILILYYLDTRHSRDSACPPWLFLYGIEYVEHGMWIHAHYPSYDHTTQRWGLIATLVTDRFGRVFKTGESTKMRLQALAALFKIRSHSLFVLKQLRNWTRAAEILQVLKKEPPNNHKSG